MKLKDYLKACWRGTEGTTLLAAFITFAFYLPIVESNADKYLYGHKNGSFDTGRMLLFLAIVVIVGLIIFKILHIIINFFYHLINKKVFLNKLETDNPSKPNALLVILIGIPVAIGTIFQVSRLIVAISEEAKLDVQKSAIIYFSLGIFIALIAIFRKPIGKALKYTYDSINGFLFSEDELKSIPILLTIITVFIFGFLIVLSAKKHSLDNEIGEDITLLSIGMVFVPLIVFLTSGSIIYRLHDRIMDDNRTNAFLKICTVICRIILLSVFTFIIVMICIVDFRLSADHIALFIMYLGFLSFQSKRLKDDFAYLSLFRK